MFVGLFEVMERKFRHLTSSRRCRLCFVFIVLFTWIITLYSIKMADVTTMLHSHVSRLHFFNDTTTVIYTNTVEELDRTIGSIRYRNCLKKYAHDMKMCSNYDTCNRNSNQSQPTGCQKRLPGCLVIGVYKAGTRALVDFLLMHPKVVVRKYPFYELQFFDKNFQRGREWYRKEMPNSMPDQVTIEKSPSYFQSDLAPARIFEMNPDTKIILMIRNPLDRAISHFTFESYVSKSQYGGSMKNCILDPWSRKVNKNCFAIKYSVYDEAMARYLSSFNLKNILIIEYDDFVNDPFSTLQKVESFLQLDNIIQKTDFIFNKDKAHYCLRENKDSRYASCYDKTRGRNISEQRYKDMSAPVREYFKTHNDKFYKLIGRNLSWN